jgi:VWA domain containing CoxE-like protein
MTDLQPDQLERLRRWRLVLGHSAQDSLCGMGGRQLGQDDVLMDEALAAIYDGSEGGSSPGSPAQRSAGLEKSAPRLAKWLGDIRTYFQEDVVAVIQNDAVERKGMKQLLLEPELLKNMQPSLALVGTLLSLSRQIPEHTKETAREVVRALVEQIRHLLESELRRAVTGALNRRQHSPIPRVDAIDWKTTIARNLKNWQPDLQRMVPERFWFWSRAQRQNQWTVIVDMDQSGSMADSVVYGAVTGSIFASLPALNTRVVAFDTEVVDLTEQCGTDPVDMLFGVQLGGGTDINKSVGYCRQFITDPAKTLFILITDLYEGGNAAQLVRRLKEMVESGVRCLCLLALSDSGIPTFDEQLARKLAGLGIPCFGCTPQNLPALIEGALGGDDLKALAEKVMTRPKRRVPKAS